MNQQSCWLCLCPNAVLCQDRTSTNHFLNEDLYLFWPTAIHWIFCTCISSRVDFGTASSNNCFSSSAVLAWGKALFEPCIFTHPNTGAFRQMQDCRKLCFCHAYLIQSQILHIQRCVVIYTNSKRRFTLFTHSCSTNNEINQYTELKPKDYFFKPIELVFYHI